ncbi:MAG: tRNA (guanine37-N1)-methyltransferase [Phycisphaerales bacterium]|jgi:tRNA (guanine37-N1)-methyltransferase
MPNPTGQTPPPDAPNPEPALRVNVLTTFPELFGDQPPAPLAVSIPGRARAAGLLDLHATNLRDFTTSKHGKTDDRPFGGGPGMVMSCQPIADAVAHAESQSPIPATRIYLTPQGQPLTQELARELATKQHLVILCGHYEGIDERVIEHLAPIEISLGDYILSAGELGAIVLIDAITRLLPGVLGHADAAAQDSFAGLPTHDPDGTPLPPKIVKKWADELGLTETPKLLDCPHYTRPREWEGRAVPEVLFGGDHLAVAKWRLEQQAQRTRDRRPDLLSED